MPSSHLAELLVRSLICGQISLCVYVHTYIIIFVICLFVCLSPQTILGEIPDEEQILPRKDYEVRLAGESLQRDHGGLPGPEMPEQIYFFSTGQNRCVRQEIVTQCFVSTELGL